MAGRNGQGPNEKGPRTGGGRGNCPPKKKKATNSRNGKGTQNRRK